jgi:polar amino acid transport system substrate-binding protein
MKHHEIKILAGAAVFALWSAASPAAADCTLNLGWEAYEPYQMETGGKVSGIDVDIFTAVAEQAGCKVVPKQVPWARLLKDIEAGKMDVAMGASINPERQAYASFSDSYRKDEFILFVKPGKVGALGDQGLDAVAGMAFKVGTVRDYAYGDAFDALMKNPAFAKNIEESAGTNLNLRKLSAGRLDGLIENRYVALATAKAEGMAGQIEAHPKPVAADDVYFMFGKKTVQATTVEAINAALKKLKADGRIDQITAGYSQ